MSAASPYPALIDSLERLRRSLTCVLEQVHLPVLSPTRPDSDDLYINRAKRWHTPVIVVIAFPGLALLMVLYVRPVWTESGYLIEHSGYSYSLGLRRHDVFHELFAWQWDRRGVSPIAYPYLHVNAASDSVPGGLGRLHIPTSGIRIEDVLSFAIVDLGVMPRQENWEALLASDD